MRKILFLPFVLFLFFNVASFGQELLELIPPSPTAFQITRFGNVPVNESTGKIFPNIPLYTYRAGRLSLPIDLSYQGNGVKVDQAAGWTGINWNLNAGGVITHSVRDKDDLYPIGSREFKSYEEIYSIDHTNQEEVNEMNSYITNTGIDSQADIFSFSFLGFSGGFYLDENMEAHLTKYDQELHIEINSQIYEDGIMQSFKKEIIITDSKGIKYYFGGLGASEKSFVMNSDANSFEQSNYAQTAFFLYKIEHPLGDIILLEYDDLSSNITVSKGETLTKVASKEMYCGGVGYDISSSLETLKSTIFTAISQTKFLKRIYSNRNNFQVEFTATNIFDNDINSHYAKKLNSIKVKIGSDVKKWFDLSYIYPHNGIMNNPTSAQRFFLKEVSFKEPDNTATEKSYSMEYNHPEELPERFSYDQDHLGFFNNKENSRYLPMVMHSSFLFTSNLANKSSDFEFSSKGVLTKLYYPTGGHTKFEYEAGLINETATEPRTKNFLLYKNYHHYYQPPNGIEERNPQTVSIPELQLIGIGDDSSTNEVLVSQDVSVRLTNIKSTEILDSHAKIYLTVHNVTDNVDVVLDQGPYMSFQYSQGTPGTDSYLGNIYNYPDFTWNNIPLSAGKQYSFTLNIETLGTFLDAATIYARVNIDYDVDSGELVEDMGIRIKRITDYFSSNQEGTNIRRFYYLSSERALAPRYLRNSQFRQGCGNLPLYNHYGMVSLMSNSINKIYNNDQKLYDKVMVSYGGDNYERGGVLKEFVLEKDPAPLYFTFDSGETISTFNLTLRENKSEMSGTLTKEVFFRKGESGSEFIPVKENKYLYDFDRSEYITNSDRVKMYDRIYNPHSNLDHLAIGVYNTYSHKVALESIISKTYDDRYIIDPTFIEEKIVYEYDQYVGLPTKETTSTSSSEETFETVYVYPNTSTSNSTYISEPTNIKKIKNIGGEHIPISSVSKGFIPSGNFPNYNGPKKLLSNIMTTKGPEFDGTSFTLENRVVYYDYDSYGNPLELSKSDGIHIVYIWGYDHQYPIAKIENATYSDIENLTSFGNNFQIPTSLSTVQEQELRDLPNAMISTYTYDPLVGVTSMTDARGYTVYYEYDEFHRLEQVKDAEGNILSKNEYKFATQN